MKDDIETQGNRFTLKGWHVALAILLVLVGLLGLYFVVRQNNVERRLKALRAAGYPTNFAELAEHTRLPVGVENAAEVYTRAFAAYVPPVDEANTPGLGTAMWPERGTPLPEPMVKALGQLLAANQRCLALLHEAGSIEHCRYNWDYRQLLTDAQYKRYCARLLEVATLYHANRGDADAALACIEDGLRFGDSLQREPALIGLLLRIACANVALAGLERSLSLTAFTDPQLKELDAALTRTGGTLDFTEAMIAERGFLVETWRNPALLGSFGQKVPFQLLPGVRGVWLTDILDSMEARIEASKLPSVERLKRFRGMDDEIQQLSFLHVMAKMVTPALTDMAELDLWLHAHLELARTALAIERYRLATGKAPEKLEELVPRYLAQVPIDPFDGRPIRYRPTQPGYLLYGVGMDGQDNGGRERSEKDREGPCDQCFIVTRQVAVPSASARRTENGCTTE